MFYSCIQSTMTDGRVALASLRQAARAIFGLVVGGASILVIGLITGMSGEMVDEQIYVKPNQGIWRSLKHSVLLTLIVGVLVGLSVSLVAELPRALFFGVFFG